jgi:galactosamine-6-phosphate isomerase
MNPALRICTDHEAVSRAAAHLVLQSLAAKPDLLLCAAGGSTPLRTYDLLGEAQAHTPKVFDSLRLVKLDEWGGLPMGAAGTCEEQMRTHLLGPLKVGTERYLGFNSQPENPKAECERVRKQLVDEGPIDLCVLGLGANGHIAMNEPASFLQLFAHIAQIAESTLQHPMLATTNSKPTYGLTLGMGEILASREILLLVSGTKKRGPMRRLLSREITPDFPASFLWLHAHWSLLCDKDCVEGLDLKL